MKILFLNADLGYGGAEKSIAFVAGEMADKGHEVVFLTYRDGARHQALNEKIKYIHVRSEDRGGKLFSALRTIFYLHGFIRGNGFDLCVAFLSPSQLRLALASRFTKTKVIFSHRSDPSVFDGKVMNSIFLHFFKRADGFVFQTAAARDRYGKKIRKKSAVIPNHCPRLVRTKDTDESRHIAVTASRLDIRQKRHDVLIDAFNEFSRDHGDYKLLIYGDGPDKETIERLARPNPNIVLMGKTSNIVEAMQEATFFVLTSDYEGIPNALIEAMSLVLPCISTRCSPGGAEMLIEDGVSGLLADCGDVKRLASAMRSIADDEKLRRTLAKNAYCVNEKFSPWKIACLWEEFFIKTVYV